VAVETLGSTSVSVTWTDNAVNEDGYKVERKPLGGEFDVSSSLPAGATAAVEADLLPGRTYTWRVVAVNDGGNGTSTEVQATLPASVDIALAKGASKDSPKAGKDTLSLSGTWSFLADAEDDAFTPRLEGLELRLGPEGAGPLVVVPPASDAWKSKGSRITWKSAKGLVPKAVVVLDTETRTFSVKVSKFDYASPPGSPFLFWLSSGNDAGPSDEAWTPRKPGVQKYP
jgi:hypothetical protein